MTVSSIVNLDGKHINLIDIPSNSNVKVTIEPPQDNTIEFTYYFSTQDDVTSPSETFSASGVSIAETKTLKSDENYYLVLNSTQQLDNIKVYVESSLLHSKNHDDSSSIIKYGLIALILIIGFGLLLRFRKN